MPNASLAKMWSTLHLSKVRGCSSFGRPRPPNLGPGSCHVVGRKAWRLSNRDSGEPLKTCPITHKNRPYAPNS